LSREFRSWQSQHFLWPRICGHLTENFGCLNVVSWQIGKSWRSRDSNVLRAPTSKSSVRRGRCDRRLEDGLASAHTSPRSLLKKAATLWRCPSRGIDLDKQPYGPYAISQRSKQRNLSAITVPHIRSKSRLHIEDLIPQDLGVTCDNKKRRKTSKITQHRTDKWDCKG
jgi:hypothetical protein